VDVSGTDKELNAAVALALLLRKTVTRKTFPQIADVSGLNERTVKRYLHGERQIGVGALVVLARAMDTTAQKILADVEAAENKSE
jgi:hypothetical protein